MSNLLQGFWFANFTIGASPNLELLIDTGSGDLILNPGVYKPSSKSKNQNAPFSVSYATTNPDGSGSETATGPTYADVVTLVGSKLTYAAQILGSITSPKTPDTFPHDGLMGFTSPDQSALGAKSWFYNLCAQKSLSACRFGLAFNTDNTGSQYFGDVPTGLFNGTMSTAPITETWTVNADVTFNGNVIEKDAEISTDSGTTVVFGPIESVQALFKAAGIQSVTIPGNGDVPTVVNGYYPCDKPPALGLAIPSASEAAKAKTANSKSVSQASTVFNILNEPLAQTKDGNNCTAVIHGTDQFPFWLVGQAFFQGHYVDHNVDDSTMGFATLAK